MASALIGLGQPAAQADPLNKLNKALAGIMFLATAYQGSLSAVKCGVASSCIVPDALSQSIGFGARPDLCFNKAIANAFLSACCFYGATKCF